MEYIPDRTALARVVLSVALVVTMVGAGATAATAQSDQPDWAVEMFEDMQPMVETYNANVDAADYDFLADLLRGENVNLVVADPANGTEASVSYRFDNDLRMQELKPGTRDDATIRMSTDKATMDRIIASDAPQTEFATAIGSGDITVSGIGMFNSIKWAIAGIVSGVLQNIFG